MAVLPFGCRSRPNNSSLEEMATLLTSLSYYVLSSSFVKKFACDPAHYWSKLKWGSLVACKWHVVPMYAWPCIHHRISNELNMHTCTVDGRPVGCMNNGQCLLWISTQGAWTYCCELQQKTYVHVQVSYVQCSRTVVNVCCGTFWTSATRQRIFRSYIVI